MPGPRFTYCLFFILSVLFVAARAQDAVVHSYAWRGVAFETPVAFSAAVDAGLDAVTFVNPPEQSPGKGRMELTLILFSKDMQESLGGSDADCHTYALTVFFGSTAPAKDAGMRAFLDQAIVGRTVSMEIPAQRTIEMYLVPLSDGSKMIIALTRYQGASEKEAQDVLLSLSRTFRETEGR